MSLGIVFKGPEGIVLAADSRATLMTQVQGPTPVLFPATFDNVTKVLRFAKQPHIGAVTYGLGALGLQEPRTAHSFIAEFESKLPEAKSNGGRLGVEEFADRLGDFFMKQWSKSTQHNNEDPMIFLVAGYDENQPYGSVFQVAIPTAPKPVEQNGGVGAFGVSWGGQDIFVRRLLAGFDIRLLEYLKEKFDLDDDSVLQTANELRGKLQPPIPFQFLPLQDCVDLAIALIRITIELQSFMVDIRGVGGHIDVATITRNEGFQAIQEKKIKGERRSP